MTTEENKAVVRRYREMHNSHDLTHLDQVVSKELVSHALIPGLPTGIEGGKMAHGMFKSAFSDLHTHTEFMIAEGDMVIEWYTATGTHTGVFMGAPATGKKFSAESVVGYRLAGGKIVETWGLNDQFTVMVQLGMIPAPGQPAGDHKH